MDGFYWDQNERSRAFARRFAARHNGRMPTKQQAGTYASVLHYLKAVDAAGSVDGAEVNARMREMPVDYLGRDGRIRPDGRVLYDVTLYEVKPPGESRLGLGSIKPVSAPLPRKSGLPAARGRWLPAGSAGMTAAGARAAARDRGRPNLRRPALPCTGVQDRRNDDACAFFSGPDATPPFRVGARIRRRAARPSAAQQRTPDGPVPTMVVPDMLRGHRLGHPRRRLVTPFLVSASAAVVI